MRNRRLVRAARSEKFFNAQMSPQALAQHIDPKISAACAAVMASLTFHSLPVFANCTTTITCAFGLSVTLAPEGAEGPVPIVDVQGDGGLESQVVKFATLLRKSIVLAPVV